MEKLYSTVVEKSVENVEKCELSTVISGFSTAEKGAYSVNIFAQKLGESVT